MKLRLPSLLYAAVLACMACASPASADTFLAEGVNYDDLASSERFYDGDKGVNWNNSLIVNEARNMYNAANKDMSVFGDLADSITTPEYTYLNSTHFSSLTNDSGHCWAYTAANMLQYWQTYYGVFAQKVGETGNTPVHGLNYDKEYLSKLAGTQSLRLNKLFYDSFENVGADPSKAFNWYLSGINGANQTDAGSAPGYFSQYFEGQSASTYVNFYPNYAGSRTLSEISDLMKTSLGYTQNSEGVWEQTIKGQIMHLDLAGTSSHAITCYGLETDENGDVTALYVVNSDDGTYNLEKVYCKLLSNGVGLYYDEDCTQAWRSNFRVTGWSSITTPEVLQDMLAEYESGKQTWMGNLESWKPSAATPADVNVLPTDATGWMKYAGTGTAHAGYYNTYYTAGSGVVFNDAASSGTVNVAEDITVASMDVDNSEKDYVFSGEGQTITTGSLSKTGSGALVFDGVKLYASGAVTANGQSITFTDDANMQSIDESCLVISGGTTTVRNDATWTNLKSLALSEESRLAVGASVNIAGNITMTDATGTLAEGTAAGIDAAYCIAVGTQGDASTGHVSLTGDMTAGSYIHIQGDADISGSISSNGTKWGTTDSHITIGGKATIGGDLIAKQYVTIGGDASIGGTASVVGALSVGGSLTLTAGKTLTANSLSVGSDLTGGSGTSATVAGSMTLGGNVSNIALSANSITMGAADGTPLTLDSVSMELTGGEVSLSNVTVTGACSFTTTAEGALTMKVDGVTFVLDGTNSSIGGADAQAFSLLAEEDGLTQTDVSSTFYLDSSMLDGVNLSGSMTLDLSYWAAEIEAGNYDSLFLSFSTAEDVNSNSSVSVTFDGTTFSELTADADSATTFTLALKTEPGQAIPEPATATLSLLALAALAVRRRRK